MQKLTDEYTYEETTDKYPVCRQYVETREKRWRKNGLLHRDGGEPAFIQEAKRTDSLTGAVSMQVARHWYINGKRHREADEPAYEVDDERGTHKAWYVNGKRHRDGDAPAIEFARGGGEWWVNGVKVDAPQPADSS
jgi:hypothetical protein